MSPALIQAQKHFLAGRLDAAAKAARDVAAREGDNLEAWLLLAQSEAAQKRFDASNQAFMAALRIAPEDPRVFLSCGRMLHDAQKWDEARMFLAKACELAPQDARAWLAFGRMLRDADALEMSLEPLRRSVALDPKLADGWVALALALQKLGQWSEADYAYDQAEALGGDAGLIASHRALLRLHQGRMDEAITQARRALERDPTPTHHFNLGCLLLTKGDYAEGWREYAWRMGLAEAAPYRPLPGIPAWDGGPLGGRSILLTFEQGLGDGLQFIRYVGAIKELGAGTIIARARKPLVSLIAAMEGIDAVITPDDPPPSVDCQAALLDLPRLLWPKVGFGADAVPYLHLDAARQAVWKKRLAPFRNRRVALAWAGNAYHENDRNRSMSLSLLSPLLARAGVDFFSFQLDAAANDIGAYGFEKKIRPLAPFIEDFMDTACALREMDLVIAVDTAVAHCAGALGVECWVILPTPPDWRWGLSGETTSWYPRMRLFRQETPRAWPDVVKRLDAAFGQWLQGAGISLGLGARPLAVDASLYQKAVAAYNARDWAQAEAILSPLCAKTDNPSVHGLMGAVRQAQGRYDEAAAIFETVALSFPESKHWNNLAAAWQMTGRKERALAAYDAAAMADPLHLSARRNRAQLLFEMGRADHARADLEFVAAETSGQDPWLAQQAARIAAQPLPPLGGEMEKARFAIERRQLQAAALILDRTRAQGRDDENWHIAALALAQARGDFRTLLPRLEKRHQAFEGAVWTVYYVRAAAMAGQKDAAHAAVKAGLERWPQHEGLLKAWAQLAYDMRLEREAVEAARAVCEKTQKGEDWLRLAGLEKNLGRWTDARDHAAKALDTMVDHPAALSLLAQTCERTGDWDRGIAAAEKLLRQDPTNLRNVSSLATLVRGRGDFAASKDLLDVALKNNPNQGYLWNALSLHYKDANDFARAIPALEKSLALGHSDPSAVVNLSLMKLVVGDYEQGWELFQARWRTVQLQEKWPRLPSPAWTGQDLAGKTILIVGEQGYGDCIQMLRYARDLRARGARVGALMAGPLARLCERVDAVDFSAKPGGVLPPHDYHVAAFSLPRSMGTRLDRMPSAAPYIQADPIAAADFAQRLRARAPQAGLRLGLVWAGNPQHANDYWRSLRLRDMLSGFVGLDLAFFSLQKDRNEDLRAGDLPMAVHDLADDLKDFADTAAALAALDGLVSIDTSVVHLAGAMGRPVWMLCPFTPDWRWGLEGRISPWYPTVEIFRQTRRGVWEDPLAHIRASLVQRLANNPS